ncbi:MAG: hypothetical protein K2G31_06620 [Clostridia bacterium]|nr:hypothetical protein [Clostridia bacterium]
MMGILKLIAGGLLALICCYVGIQIKKRYRLRATFYKSASEYAQVMSSELSLSKTPLPDIARKFTQGRSGEFERVLTECVSLAIGGGGYEAAMDKVSVAHLKNDEKKEILSFLCGGGKSALSDQLSQVEYYKNLFEQKRKKCEEESKKLGGMYFKLCVLLGLAIMLILA